MFPKYLIIYKKYYGLKFNNLQLDVFVSSLNLAFEYQGEQHFEQRFLFKPLIKQQETDQEKRIACSENGITLIEIPYWWDRSLDRFYY